LFFPQTPLFPCHNDGIHQPWLDIFNIDGDCAWLEKVKVAKRQERIQKNRNSKVLFSSASWERKKKEIEDDSNGVEN